MKPFLLKLKHYWLTLGNFIGMINAKIILSFLYFLILPIFALPYKVYLSLKKKEKSSNWDTYDRTPDITEQF